MSLRKICKNKKSSKGFAVLLDISTFHLKIAMPDGKKSQTLVISTLPATFSTHESGKAIGVNSIAQAVVKKLLIVFRDRSGL